MIKTKVAFLKGQLFFLI